MRAKTGKANRARRRTTAQPRAGVAALALSQQDIDDLHWAAAVVDEHKLIWVKCKEVKAKCPACKHQFVARKEIRHEVKNPDLEKAAGVILRILAKRGTGATLHFARKGE